MEGASATASPGTVVESRRLCEGGKFAAALDALSHEMRAPAPADALLAEVVRVNIIRGDRTSAVRELDKYETLVSQTPDSSLYLEVLSLQRTYIGVSERGDLDVAVQAADRIWEKCGLDSSKILETSNEATVLAAYYALEIYDLHRRYGEGLNGPSFEPSSDLLRLLISRLDSAQLAFEALELAEYFTAEPVDLLDGLATVRLAGGRPSAAGDAVLRLAKAHFESGKVGDAEAALGILDEVEAGCPRTDARHEVLVLRYGDAETADADDGKIPRIRRLVEIAAAFRERGDLDDAMEALERAAELHSGLRGDSDGASSYRLELGLEIHDSLRSLCTRSGDLLSGAQFEFRRCDMLASLPPSSSPMTTAADTGLAAARARRDELLEGAALPICARLPFFNSLHRRQCLEHLMVQQRDAALRHATVYVEHCAAGGDGQRLALAENLRFTAMLLPTRGSDEARMALLEKTRAKLERGAECDAEQGRVIAYAEKVLLLAESADELARLGGEDREDAWPPIAEMLAEAKKRIYEHKTLRSEPAGELLALEVSCLGQAFSSPTFGLVEALGSGFEAGRENYEDETAHYGENQPFSPTRFVSDLYIAVRAECAALFGALASRMKSLGQHLRARGHPLQKAQFLLCEAILYYVLAHYLDTNFMRALKLGFETKADGLAESLKCFEASLAAETEVEHQVHDGGGGDMARLLALQSYHTSALKALLFEVALSVSYEMGDNDLLWKWVQRSKARAYSTWMVTSSCRVQNQTPILLSDLSYENLLWVSSATSRTVVFVDWVAVRLDPDRSVLLLLALQFARDPDGPFRKLSVFDLDASVEDAEEWARGVTPARLDGPDWPRTLGPLAPLVRPLADCSRPGDILVLSPTAPLHGLPLHALSLPGEGDVRPLMERNPVVYVPSLRVLVACIRRLEAPSAGAERSREWNAALFAAYNDDVPSDPERNTIYSFLRTLGECLGSPPPVLGTDLDANAFTRCTEKADLILFYGHGEVSEHHPAQQSLLLGNDRLTLANAASLDLRRAPHVSLVACWGGTQDFSLGGDEPLGLPSALLAAGAASGVGPLWPIKSKTGRAFTEHFFDQSFLDREVDRRELGPVINLAEALGCACGALRKAGKETATPYHWAAFALHGAWFCRRGREHGRH